MSEPTVIAPGGGELVGDSADRRVEILSDHDALHATWSRFGPGREGADLHVHRRHTDLFYVLAGELTVRLGTAGEEVVAPAGALARVPPLVVHGFRNAAGAELRYLNFHAPGVGFADYMRALRDGRTLTYDQEPPPADGGRPATEAAIGAGETVADGVTLLADADEIAVADVRTGGGGPPPFNARQVQSFYVLEGALEVSVADREILAEPGSWVQLPPGVPHAVSCPGPARYLHVHAPNGGHGAFLRALRGRALTATRSGAAFPSRGSVS